MTGLLLVLSRCVLAIFALVLVGAWGEPKNWRDVALLLSLVALAAVMVLA